MHFYSLRELASEEPSESGRNIGTLHLQKPLPLRRRRLAPPLQHDRRRQQDLLVNCGQQKVHPMALEGAKLALRNLMVGQHDGSVISCVRTDRDLRLYVRSVAS